MAAGIAGLSNGQWALVPIAMYAIPALLVVPVGLTGLVGTAHLTGRRGADQVSRPYQ